MLYVMIAAVVFAADFFIKKQIDGKRKLGEESRILKNRVIIRKYYNKGAIFDALEQWPRVVQILCGSVMLILSGIFIVLLREKGQKGLKLGMALVLGGGASNLYDRLTKGHVVDYVSFKSRFSGLQRIVFNISDFCIFLGSLIMLIFRKR